MEDIVDLPFPGQRETDSQGGDNFLDPEGTMILVVQLLRRPARFDVAPIEHYQVSYLVCRGFLPGRIRVLTYSFLCIFQPLPGLVVHGVHPVGVTLACWVEGFRSRGVHGFWVEAIVSVEQGHTIPRGGRVVVGELGHR